jgi:hypothetical protein
MLTASFDPGYQEPGLILEPKPESGFCFFIILRTRPGTALTYLRTRTGGFSLKSKNCPTLIYTYTV